MIKPLLHNNTNCFTPRMFYSASCVSVEAILKMTQNVTQVYKEQIQEIQHICQVKISQFQPPEGLNRIHLTGRLLFNPKFKKRTQVKSHGPLNIFKTRGMYSYSCFPPPSSSFTCIIHLKKKSFHYDLILHLSLLCHIITPSDSKLTTRAGFRLTYCDQHPVITKHFFFNFSYMKSHVHALDDGSSVFHKSVSWNMRYLKCLNLVRTTVLLQIQLTFERWLSVNLWHKFMRAEMGRQHLCATDVQL